MRKPFFYGYGGYVYEIVDKEGSGVIVVIQVSYYLTNLLGGLDPIIQADGGLALSPYSRLRSRLK